MWYFLDLTKYFQVSENFYVSKRVRTLKFCSKILCLFTICSLNTNIRILGNYTEISKNVSVSKFVCNFQKMFMNFWTCSFFILFFFPNLFKISNICSAFPNKNHFEICSQIQKKCSEFQKMFVVSKFCSQFQKMFLFSKFVHKLKNCSGSYK